MSTSEMFAAGGIVMWPLLLFSVLVLILAIERAVFWSRIRRRQRSLIKRALVLYEERPGDAIALLKKSLNFPIARVFLEALEVKNASPNQFRLALEGATHGEIPLLKRFSSVFQTVIAIAPLLGLLGTILGLIRSFAAVRIGEMGADASQVTGGISEALVSTAAGMVVAIFALAAFNIFRSCYRRQLSLLQEYSSQLEILYERHNSYHYSKESAYASVQR
ncbi:MotA/TolQ/ExbB proton channel family protein [cf. Phormidesmis sp. LEGE 11477]|uniref:MotA/TolQ/ExbB proton channel family protein n=1 Tax=cf. Phormidesmis sp. LEGE 11477 TaxID=1828680 RepID=UPI001880D4D5|nr:MotA/TolQ/ExbB proton channel family protein [cf. Phormidesmis sp. LEGE 11477]MBE9060853.1 MotA/TolQ/ExbB proton channel family protein [cf. Phormidesmis sp. LEGE 11477]